MTVNELKDMYSFELLAGGGGLSREVDCGYSGDLLSWVMGRAPENSAWVTVMGNINAVAVALLADISCIILADNSVLDTDAASRADAEDIPILRAPQNQYDICCKLYEALKK